jgi:hypothetical protein
MAMNEVRPELPIWRTAMAGYRDGLAALFRDGKLFRYFVYASVLSLFLFAGQFAGQFDVAVGASPASLTDQLFGLLISVAYAVAISPLAVAVHRNLLLGEAPHELYVVAMFRTTQLRLALATMAVYGLFFVAQLAIYPVVYVSYGVNPFNADELGRALSTQPSLTLFVTAATWVGSVFAALIATRFTFAFPGLATGAPGASLRWSFAETRGSMWRLFFIFLLVLALPFLVLVIAVVVASVLFFVQNPEATQAPEGVEAAMMLSPMFLVAYAVAFVAMMAVVVVIGAAAARAYEIRVNRGMSGVAEVFA